MTTAPTKTVVYKTALGSYPHTQALKDGTVTPRGIKLEYVDVGSNIILGFPRMVRSLEFDVSELAITTYLTARAFNKPFTMLPVVVARNFHHGAMSYNVKSGIQKPKDLEGKRVGVRSYTVTAGVWNRAVLATEYGVDLDKITWVTYEEPHVKEYQSPGNVVRAPEGKTLPGMLRAGETDAAIGAGITDSPDIRPLIPDARNAEADWYRRKGIYPINHTVVIKDELLASDPWIAQELFSAFKASKEIYLKRLEAEGPSSPEDETRIRLKNLIGGDPWPYGVEQNRKALETLIQFAYDQKVLPRKVSIEEVLPEVMLRLE